MGDDEKNITIRIEINSSEYEFEVPVDEWDAMSDSERINTVDDCEIEARERYCENRTWVNVTRPDGTEEEI